MKLNLLTPSDLIHVKCVLQVVLLTTLSAWYTLVRIRCDERIPYCVVCCPLFIQHIVVQHREVKTGTWCRGAVMVVVRPYFILSEAP